MRTYKGFTSEQRMASHRKLMKMVAAGEAPKAERCQACGQTEGIIDYHNADYSHPSDHVVHLCFRCHMVVHCSHIDPDAAMVYWLSIGQGNRYAPFHTRNFPKFAKEHGFNRRSKTRCECCPRPF